MSTSAPVANDSRPTLFDRIRSLDGLRLDWVVVLLSLLFAAGLSLDGRGRSS